MKRRGLFSVFFVFLLVWGFSQTANSNKVLRGKVWHSFDDTLCVIESDNNFYYLHKKSVSKDVAYELTQVGKEVSVVVPENAIKFVENPTVANTNIKFASDPVETVEVKDGKIRMKGKLLPSTEGNTYSVEIGNFVYRIGQGYIASNTKYGEHLELVLPVSAIQSVYELPHNPLKKPSLEEAGEISLLANDQYNIRGEVLYSFTDAYVLLKVKGLIYRLERDFLSTQQMEQVSHIGSAVNITVPARSIDSYWNAESDFSDLRLPASH